MRTYVSSLGCKLNQVEIETLANQLAVAGHEIVPSPDEAELCILNTCAVTHVAAQKTRQALRRMHRENPSTRLVATGCYAELSPAELGELPGVELVTGNQDKGNLVELLGGLLRSPESGGPDPESGTRAHFHPCRTRALVKIQDGCDNACTYCIIHVARGPQHSRSVDLILSDVRARLDAGHQEVVLTGVHIGAYGRDGVRAFHGGDLWTLVGRILAETPVPRLRLSSIEPWDLPKRALRLWDDRRLCRHLHLPLQSGCDATLKRMDRHYTAAQFTALVAAARDAIPDLAVTTDVIAGFPGETAEEFEASLALVKATQFARVHVFPFSLRPGTPAAGMQDQVPPAVKAERARAMRRAAEAGRRAFCQRFVGRTMEVLWESSRKGEAGLAWRGLTDNYLRVTTTDNRGLSNTLTPARLVALSHGGLEGRIAE
ncbi:tRNA (N(6)-L-threonylcarbamoyladenosine(37)-C(2))-methylthiotransferase MtaB [Chloroflexota bacterium]